MKNIKYIIGIILCISQNLCQANITTMHEDPAVNKQLLGDFSDMKRKESLPLGALQSVWDKSSPKQGIHEVDFVHNEVIKIRLREHMSTIVEFPVWEKIEKSLLGMKA